MKYFFSHLIEIESVILELEKLGLSRDQKVHLAFLIDSQLHHTILDAILSQLNDAEKRIFAKHLTEGNHDKIWKFLNDKIDGVEDRIKETANQLKEELHKDLQRARKETK
ncbi:hypothetical protein HYT74_03695 [Candidatus Daviesbacteria bacterium]|nr:hypothetical protein [Candidatus Daviesbacteria bacterium]